MDIRVLKYFVTVVEEENIFKSFSSFAYNTAHFISPINGFRKRTKL